MAHKISFDHISLSSQGLVLPMGLRVATLDLSIDQGSVDGDTRTYRWQGEAPASARIDEKDLADFLTPRLPDSLKNVSVRCGDGVIQINAEAKIVFTVQVKVYCRLEIQANTQLVVKVHSVEPGIAESLVEGQVEKMNPVFQASDLPVPIQLSSVEVRDGSIFLDGFAISG